MRFLYTLIWCLFLPFVLLRLLLLSRANPGYRKRISERFGFIKPVRNSDKVIWIHAVSVGETQAIQPLVEKLLADFPAYQILLSTTTPTGAAHAEKLFGGRIQHRYFPYDVPIFIHRFLQRCRPCLVLIVETELWPNLCHACAGKNIPLLLVNARLSEKSAKRYAIAGQLTRQMLRNISAICCRSSSDSARFQKLGATPDQLKTVGNLKFDQLPEPGVEAQTAPAQIDLNRLLWIAASTHPGEEEIILRVYKQLLQRHAQLQLVLAPRHPDRCEDIVRLLQTEELSVHRHSNPDVSNPGTVQVYLIDTLGELGRFYHYADLAFIGGSLVDIGGHNLLEPAACGKAITSGHHLHNFQEIAAALEEIDAIKIVDSEQELFLQSHRLLQSEACRQRMGASAQAFVEQNRGATGKLYELISSCLD